MGCVEKGKKHVMIHHNFRCYCKKCGYMIDDNEKNESNTRSFNPYDQITHADKEVNKPEI